MSNVNKAKLNTAIRSAYNPKIKIDTSKDNQIEELKNFSWDDLFALKEELASALIKFVLEVQNIIGNKTIIENLGDKKEHFEKLVKLFFHDIDNFSKEVGELVKKHEHRRGPIVDLDDFDEYNKIAIQYHVLYTELTNLISPTLTDIILTINEVIPDAHVIEPNTNSNVLN